MTNDNRRIGTRDAAAPHPMSTRKPWQTPALMLADSDVTSAKNPGSFIPEYHYATIGSGRTS